MNRANDFSTKDEKKTRLKVESDGRVFFTRVIRMRSMIGTSIENYPFDVQVRNSYSPFSCNNL